MCKEIRESHVYFCSPRHQFRTLFFENLYLSLTKCPTSFSTAYYADIPWIQVDRSKRSGHFVCHLSKRDVSKRRKETFIAAASPDTQSAVSISADCLSSIQWWSENLDTPRNTPLSSYGWLPRSSRSSEVNLS